MAGLFQVLWGSEDGFEPAEALTGTDDEPLIIPGGKGADIDRICTRPFAADVDDDGDLDLIVGNFAGSFFMFEGEGEGKFGPKATRLKSSKGKSLTVPHHSDPFLVDWDGDGDLDMLSGSSSGGVFLSVNEGSVKEYSFAKFKKLIPGVKIDYNKVRFGDDFIDGPQGSTRVWADDVNGDGKLDLLVGDSVRLMYPAEGLDEETAMAKLEEWNKEQAEFATKNQNLIQFAYDEESEDSDSEESDSESSDAESEENESADDSCSSDQEQEAEATDETQEEDEEKDSDKKETKEEKQQRLMKEYQEGYMKLWEKRSEIVREEATGFVWVYIQK